MDKLEEVAELRARDKYDMPLKRLIKRRRMECFDYAKQICSLFEPSPDPSMLLGDEELVWVMNYSKGMVDTYDENILQVCRDVAKAQLSHCEPLVRAKMLEEVDEAYENGKREGYSLGRADIEQDERAKAFKEVGEWLGKYVPLDEPPGHFTIQLYKLDIQKLKKGEL